MSGAKILTVGFAMLMCSLVSSQLSRRYSDDASTHVEWNGEDIKIPDHVSKDSENVPETQNLSWLRHLGLGLRKRSPRQQVNFDQNPELDQEETNSYDEMPESIEDQEDGVQQLSKDQVSRDSLNSFGRSERRPPSEEQSPDDIYLEQESNAPDEGHIFNDYQKSDNQESPHVDTYDRKSRRSASNELERESLPKQGYELYEGIGTYKFHADGADDFDAASDICEREGGRLAIVNSQDEADVFLTLWIRHGGKVNDGDDAYVGIHRRNPDKAFRTLLGVPVESTGYAAWRLDEHKKTSEKECVSFYRYGGYRDISCKGRRPFICELPGRE